MRRKVERTMLIIKTERFGSRRKDLEKWIIEKLKTEEVKIIRGRKNKEAAKVIFKNRRERERVWEKERN